MAPTSAPSYPTSLPTSVPPYPYPPYSPPPPPEVLDWLKAISAAHHGCDNPNDFADGHCPVRVGDGDSSFFPPPFTSFAGSSEPTITASGSGSQGTTIISSSIFPLPSSLYSDWPSSFEETSATSVDTSTLSSGYDSAASGTDETSSFATGTPAPASSSTPLPLPVTINKSNPTVMEAVLGALLLAVIVAILAWLLCRRRRKARRAAAGGLAAAQLAAAIDHPKASDGLQSRLPTEKARIDIDVEAHVQNPGTSSLSLAGSSQPPRSGRWQDALSRLHLGQFRRHNQSKQHLLPHSQPMTEAFGDRGPITIQNSLLTASSVSVNSELDSTNPFTSTTMTTQSSNRLPVSMPRSYRPRIASTDPDFDGFDFEAYQRRTDAESQDPFADHLFPPPPSYESS